MQSDYSKKRLIFSAAIVVLFGFLSLKIFTLQIYSRDRYLRKSEQNRIRIVPVEPPRGLIVDRTGNVTVDNRPAYSVSVIPYAVERSDTVLNLLGDILQIPSSEIEKRIHDNKTGNFTPAKIMRYIDFVQLATLEENRLYLPGVIIEFEPDRFYPYGSVAPHAFGYISEIASEELSMYKDGGYLRGDIIGKKGLEKQFERVLHGSKGYSYREVDALGREVGIPDYPKYTPPNEGHTLITTLDINLQNHLSHLLEDKKGAAVMLDCRNGEVLALVSKPDFDLNIFAGPVQPDEWSALVNDSDKPLFDRSIQSVFPPGSTFKLVLAAAALETNTISEEREYECTGFTRLGTRTFACWKEGGHGKLNLLGAIAQSCNVYFYRLSLEVGLKAWAEYARYFGFGTATGIDIPGESAGIVPDSTFLNDRYGKGQWTRGMLMNLAVGQGDLSATPLQMAQMAMAIANDGIYYRPHLIKAIVNPADGARSEVAIERKRVPEVSVETFALLKEGMFQVVNSEHGTGRGAYLPGVTVSGKTGTAQNPHGEDHAWFIGFAPHPVPEVALCIFIENGGGGGAVAAPLARSVLNMYFSRTSSPPPQKVPPVEDAFSQTSVH